MMERIGERLLDLRRRRGLSQTELAGLAGVHLNTVLYLERGQLRTVLLSTLEKLSGALEVTVSDLIAPHPRRTSRTHRRKQNHAAHG